MKFSLQSSTDVDWRVMPVWDGGVFGALGRINIFFFFSLYVSCIISS